MNELVLKRTRGKRIVVAAGNTIGKRISEGMDAARRPCGSSAGKPRGKGIELVADLVEKAGFDCYNVHNT